MSSNEPIPWKTSDYLLFSFSSLFFSMAMIKGIDDDDVVVDDDDDGDGDVRVSL